MKIEHCTQRIFALFGELLMFRPTNVIHRNSLSSLSMIIFSIVIFTQQSNAQTATPAMPVDISPVGVVGELRNIQDLIHFIPPRNENVGDQSLYPHNILYTDQLTFGDKSELVFSHYEAPYSSGPGSLLGELLRRPETGFTYIVASKILIEGEAAIGWARNLQVGNQPPERPRAPDGRHGVSYGESGTDGQHGDVGNPGYSGSSGPTLFILAKEIAGGKLKIDNRGQIGGSGGKGQDGGHGGDGARGAPASSSFFNCKRGAGRGGNGGNGGNAGLGGAGGDGGSGGDIILVLPSTADKEAIISHIEAYVDGGSGGPGGKHGDPGQPGNAGPPGEPALPFCRPEPERRGNAGTEGKTASEVPKTGMEGLSGTFGVTVIDAGRFEEFFRFR